MVGDSWTLCVIPVKACVSTYGVTVGYAQLQDRERSVNHFWRRFGHWLNIFGFFLAGMALLASMNGQFSHMSPEDLWERGLG